MKNVLQHLTVLLILTAPAVGQEAVQQAPNEQTRIGIGIGLEPTRLFLTSSATISSAIVPVSLFMPISFGSSFRLEPEFGMYKYSRESSSGSSTSSADGSVLRIGAGALFILTSGENYNLYLGPRVGLYFASSESASGSSSMKMSETDFTVGIAVGSEYFVTPHLSFGGEAQLNYVSFGDEEVTYTPPPPFPTTPTDDSQSFIWSNAVFLFRWYF